MDCFVKAYRCQDLWDSNNYGRLICFWFYRKRPYVYWNDGEVYVKFPSWSIAQKAVNQLRSGDSSLWNSYVYPGENAEPPIGVLPEFNN